MSEPLPPEDELPPPSPELVIIGIQHSALMAVLDRLEHRRIKPRQFRREYLRELEERWQRTENHLVAVRLRSPAHDRAVAAAFHRARAWWLKMVGTVSIHDDLGTK